MRKPYHLGEIAQFCAKHPTDRKILFVPSRQVGYNLLTHLARSGSQWVNLEPMSVSDFAEIEYGPLLRSRGLKRISGDLILIIVARVLYRIKEDDPDGYFAPIAVTPSLVRSVWATLGSIRMARIDPAVIGSRVSDSKKGRALTALARGFEDEIAEGKWYDGARLIRESQHAGRPTVPGEGVKHAERYGAIMEETPLSALERELLESTFGSSLVVIGRQEYGIPSPESSTRKWLGPAVIQPGEINPAGLIASGDLKRANGSKVTLWGARGPEEEFRDVVRYALSNGIPLDDVEIAYSRSATYLPLIVDLADGLEMDVAFAEGVPAILTRPGRGLIGFVQWILEDMPAKQLAGLLQSGLMQFERTAGETTVQMSTLASLLLEAPIGERIERYESGFDALIHEAKSRLESEDDSSTRAAAIKARVDELMRLKRSIADLVAAIPAESHVAVDKIAELALRFLQRNAVVHGDRDTVAQESLIDRVERLQGEPQVVPRRFGIQMLADMIEQHTVQVSTARRGALYAADISRAGYTGRKHLFIVGLDVDSFPGRTNEDPILLDLERERVSSNLGKRSIEAGERLWHLSRALGMAADRVFLGTPVFDAEREDTSVYPSPFMQSAASQLGFQYSDLPSLEGADSTLDGRDLLLPQRNKADFRGVLAACYRSLADGQIAVDARRDLEFGVYDGWLGQSDALFQISVGQPVFSNTRLERLANCGYRYFLADVLKLRKPEYYEMDPARWLLAKDFGILLHDLYHDFLQRIAETADPVKLEDQRSLILAMLDDAIERYRQRFPEENLAAFNHEVQRLRQSAETFIRTEALSDSVPRRFELVFGYPEAEDEVLQEPIVIDLGGGLAFSLSGRIDRIDESDAGLIIWDYKTGNSWKFKQGSLLRGGLNLQWALYAVALEQIRDHLGLDGPVIRSGYYFASDRENGLQIAERPLTKTELEAVIGPLFGMVNLGAFLKVNKDESACKYCDFKSLCSRESVKVRNMSNRWTANSGAAFYGALDRWMSIPE